MTDPKALAEELRNMRSLLLAGTDPNSNGFTEDEAWCAMRDTARLLERAADALLELALVADHVVERMRSMLLDSVCGCDEYHVCGKPQAEREVAAYDAARNAKEVSRAGHGQHV